MHAPNISVSLPRDIKKGIAVQFQLKICRLQHLAEVSEQKKKDDCS